MQLKNLLVAPLDQARPAFHSREKYKTHVEGITDGVRRGFAATNAALFAGLTSWLYLIFTRAIIPVLSLSLHMLE